MKNCQIFRLQTCTPLSSSLIHQSIFLSFSPLFYFSLFFLHKYWPTGIALLSSEVLRDRENARRCFYCANALEERERERRTGEKGGKMREGERNRELERKSKWDSMLEPQVMRMVCKKSREIVSSFLPFFPPFPSSNLFHGQKLGRGGTILFRKKRERRIGATARSNAFLFRRVRAHFHRNGIRFAGSKRSRGDAE